MLQENPLMEIKRLLNERIHGDGAEHSGVTDEDLSGGLLYGPS